MDWLSWVAMLALAWVVGPFVGPIAVRRKLWKARQPRFQLLARESLPGEAAPFLTTQADRLQSQGFELVGYAAMPDLSPGTTSPVALLVDRAAGDLAMAACVATGSFRAMYVEFCTELASGRELNTNNGDGLGCEAPHPGKREFAFPGLDDLERLCGLHRRLVRQAALGHAARRPAAGAEFDELVRGMERDHARQARSGYWYLDAGGARYRPTWKGALLMTWKLAWPVGALRRVLRRRQAAGLLRRLEAP